MSPGMKDGFSHDQALREAPQIRVCLIGLLVFAFERGDQALVAAIDRILDDPPAPLNPDSEVDRRLADALAREVDKVELTWWRQTHQLALGCGKARAIYRCLAQVRVGSDRPV